MKNRVNKALLMSLPNGQHGQPIHFLYLFMGMPIPFLGLPIDALTECPSKAQNRRDGQGRVSAHRGPKTDLMGPSRKMLCASLLIEVI
jgi:hypothetical protein